MIKKKNYYCNLINLNKVVCGVYYYKDYYKKFFKINRKII